MTQLQSQQSRSPQWTGGVPVWGILLVALGILLLLQTTGAVDWALWGSLWRFWPVIIIGIGVDILLRHRAPWLASFLILAMVVGSILGAWALMDHGGEGVVSDLAEPLGNVEAASVQVDFGVGNLVLGSLPESSANLVEGHFETPSRAAKTSVDRSGERVSLRLSMETRRWFTGASDARWDVKLSRSPRLSLDVNGGAADMTLDLRDLQVTDLELDTGASDVDVTVPSTAGHVSVRVNAGAANIRIVVPEGVAARIVMSSGLSSIDVDTARFPKTGNTYISPNFGDALNRVDIDLRVGAAKVSVR